jgi:hypothetical protein
MKALALSCPLRGWLVYVQHWEGRHCLPKSTCEVALAAHNGAIRDPPPRTQMPLYSASSGTVYLWVVSLAQQLESSLPPSDHLSPKPPLQITSRSRSDSAQPRSPSCRSPGTLPSPPYGARLCPIPTSSSRASSSDGFLRALRIAKVKPNITGFTIEGLRAATKKPKYDPWERRYVSPKPRKRLLQPTVR